MDDADILLSCLYTNPPAGVPRNKIDSAHADYKVALERGEKITFGDMLVRKGILKKGEPDRILKAEKSAYSKSNVKGNDKKRAASTPKPVKAAAPPPPEKKKKTDWTKQAVPAVLVGLLAAAVIWRALPKPPLPVETAAAVNKTPRVDWLDPPKGGGIATGLPLGEDPTLDVVRDIIAQATSGDADEAEKKLEKAIQDAKSPEEKERLEEVRWRLRVVKKQRRLAKEALEEAKKLAKAGKTEEAADKLAGVDVPEDSPERRAIDEAKRGGGPVGRELEPKRPDRDPKNPKDPGDSKARPPRDHSTPPKVSRKEKPLPAAPRGEDAGPVSAPPPPPEGGDENAPITGDEKRLVSEGKKTRKHGQRPRGEAKNGGLVTSFIDDVDEDPEDDDAADPASFNGGVPPIALATPREVEPERADAIAALTSEGLEYLAKVQAWIKEQRAYRDGALEREAARVKNATSDDPIARPFLKRIEIPGGALVLNDATVVQYDSSGFKLRDSKKTEWGSSWRQSPEIGCDVRRLAVDPNEPRDLMRLGRWCARFRFFPQAKTAFRKAVAIDGALRDRVPDLDALEKETALFHGKFARTGDAIRATWNFDASTDLLDFDPQGSIWVAGGKVHLECRDKTPAVLLGQKSVVFRDGVAIDVRFDPGKGLLILGFSMRSTDEEAQGRAHLFQVRYDTEGGRALLVDTAFQQPLAVGDAGRGITTARLEVQKDALWVRVGNFHAKVPLIVPPSWEVLPFVGSLGGTVSVDQVVLSGRAHGDWLKKSLGGTDFRMALRLEDAIGAPPFAYRHPEPQISAEISYLATDVTPEVLKMYEKAKKNIEKKTTGAYVAALGELKFVTDEAPDFAPGQFLLAKCALVFQRRAFALECLNEAVSSAGGFAEALALRARVLAQLRRFDEADADVKKALEWRPDLACVHAEAGELALAEQRIVNARDDLELASALNPTDANVEWMAALVGHAVDGPPWEKPVRVETDHYAWGSSLADKRVRQIADLLEEVRPLYESCLGIKAPKEKRKSAVLFFDSVASFQDYNQIAIQSGLPDAAIGVFFPLTKELQVCDVLDDPSGMKTCAIAFHEGFHQFFDRIVETNTIPYWCNEGLGDYFGGATIETGLVRVGQIQKGRLANLFQLGAIPLDDLMNDDGPNFMAHGFQRYAQSWSVVHYLMEGDKQKWKPLLVAYLEHLRAGRSPVNAYNRTFGRIDMDELESGWRRHVLSLVRQLQAR